MAIEHILTDADTVQSLAYRYLGSATRWKEIVDFNSLEYPYTLTSEEAHHKLYASGYLRLTRELYQSALTIYAGSTFATKIDGQGIRKVYQVVEDTTIPAGAATGYVYVRCEQYGTFGNTIAEAITSTLNLYTSLGQHVSISSVINEAPFTNGTDATVKITGEALYIPTSAEEDVVQDVSLQNFLQQLGGEDLRLDADGDLMDDGFGDLASAAGVENIAQSVRHRLMSERGSLPHHPHYGTRLEELIGRAQTPYVPKLVELDIIESLSYDDRFSAVTVNSIEIKQTALHLDITITLENKVYNYRDILNFVS